MHASGLCPPVSGHGKPQRRVSTGEGGASIARGTFWGGDASAQGCERRGTLSRVNAFWLDKRSLSRRFAQRNGKTVGCAAPAVFRLDKRRSKPIYLWRTSDRNRGDTTHCR